MTKIDPSLIYSLAIFRLSNPRKELPKKLKEVEEELKEELYKKIKEDVQRVVASDDRGVEQEQLQRIKTRLTEKETFGYCNHCASIDPPRILYNPNGTRTIYYPL